MEIPVGLSEHPFSYRITQSGEVRVERDGRGVGIIRGAAARRLVPRLGASDENDQLLLAKATGNYKRGNERKRAEP